MIFYPAISPWDPEVSVLRYRACDVLLAGWKGDFAILYLDQSLPYGINANDCSASYQMETESEFRTHDSRV
jgi:hypothetical protein